MRQSREPNFSFLRLKIYAFGHKLDTFFAIRAEPKLAYRAIKSVFKVKKSPVFISSFEFTSISFNLQDNWVLKEKFKNFLLMIFKKLCLNFITHIEI